MHLDNLPDLTFTGDELIEIDEAFGIHAHEEIMLFVREMAEANRMMDLPLPELEAGPNETPRSDPLFARINFAIPLRPSWYMGKGSGHRGI